MIRNAQFEKGVVGEELTLYPLNRSLSSDPDRLLQMTATSQIRLTVDCLYLPQGYQFDLLKQIAVIREELRFDQAK